MAHAREAETVDGRAAVGAVASAAEAEDGPTCVFRVCLRMRAFVKADHSKGGGGEEPASSFCSHLISPPPSSRGQRKISCSFMAGYVN